MVKIVVEFYVPDEKWDVIVRLYPGNAKKHIENLISDHNTVGLKAKIIEMPEKKGV